MSSESLRVYRIRVPIPACSDSLRCDKPLLTLTKGTSVRSTVNRRRLAAVVVLGALTLPSSPALAAAVDLFSASDFFIPRPASATDQEGVERQIGSFDLAANGYADLIGQECSFSVLADNGDSVNENNYAIIRTGGSETDVYETESLANVTNTLLEHETLVVGPTIEVFNVMIPGTGGIVGSSVNLTVSVDCAATTTTTTTPSSTSTSTTTPPAPTPSSSTTSTSPEDPPTTSTTAAITTSTTEPGASTSGDTSTTVATATGGTLPFTGLSGEGALAAGACALVLLGGAGVAAARPRGRHSR